MEATKEIGRAVNILLVEDDPIDQVITLRALQDCKIRNQLYIVSDGQAALDFLYRQGEYTDQTTAPRPDLILLDLNLPKVNGKQVLEAINADPVLRPITVFVMSTSKQQEDVLRSYELGCKSFIAKPVSSAKFFDLIRTIDDYWIELVILPRKTD